MQRDEAELRALYAQPDTPLRAQYICMHMTERLAAPAAAAEPSWTLQATSAQEQVAAYRRSRGFPAEVRFLPDSHSASRAQYQTMPSTQYDAWLERC